MLFEKFTRKGSEFLGVKYPIISGGMTWISDFELVRAVAGNGAFPVLAGGNMPPEIFEKEVDRCIENLDKPFAVNLITISPNYQVQYEILLSKKVPFVVFAGSFPRKADIQGMKESGKRTMSFASEGSIAEQQIRFGIDALILEGSEAGGHIGHVSLMVLLQQVLFNYDQVPVFVAGGIASGRMIAHLLLMGAAGCQLGTAFVMSEECTAHANFKKAFARAHARQAIATPQYDSRLPVVAVRAIKNQGTDKFGRLQLELLEKLEAGIISREQAQYEVENFWVGALRRAVVDGDIEDGSLMAGQSVGLVREVLPMKSIIEKLVHEARAELTAVQNRLNTQSV
ncbi:MAG: nitronate monooxygenase [bacterium]|jgi:enoyl-[acyl-carrier protein] reductase II|nr:nitronate monooxygenase [bacterium]MDD3804755.1 nitronate monooxygenase [bacterium]MDD4558033.1 nitronate monooxygenase [bacterium]